MSLLQSTCTCTVNCDHRPLHVETGTQDQIPYTAHIVMDVRQTKNTALCWSHRANKPLNSCWKAVNFRSKIHLSVRTFKRGNKYI